MKKIHIFAKFTGRYIKKIFFILFHVRGHGSFPGLIFHIQDVENEPPVLKKIPPLHNDIVYNTLKSLDVSTTSTFATEGDK